MAPLLFADRFYLSGPDDAADLATGEHAWIRRVVFDGRQDQEAWLRRCAALSSVWHPNLVSLVDFGEAGRTGCFEAWACASAPPRWKGRDPATGDIVSSVVRFLMARSLSPGRLRWASIIDLAGRPALLPAADTGLPLITEGQDGSEQRAGRLARLVSACAGARRSRSPAGEISSSACEAAGATGEESVNLVERLTDVLNNGVSGRPRAVRFRIPRGPDGAVVLRALARTARVQGYVPVTSGALLAGSGERHAPARWRDAIAGRHVLLLHETEREWHASDAALLFLSLGLSSDRPHVLLRLEDTAMPDVPRALALREKSADYRVGASRVSSGRPAIPDAAAVQASSWVPAHAAVALGTEAQTRAISEAAASGRHAQAERWLRETMGRCGRRREEGAAGEAALALGRLLLVRGQLAEACRALECARQHFDHACIVSRAGTAAVFVGLAWTDGGRFQAAEAALRSAGIAAGQAGEGGLQEFAALALARCLYWQERFGEAWESLAVPEYARYASGEPELGVAAGDWSRLATATCARERLSGAPAVVSSIDDPADRWAIGAISVDVARACLSARIALGLGDLARAGRAAAEAREHAERSGSPTELAAACRAKAAVFSAISDGSALRDQVEEGIEAARRAHAPLRALRLRVVMAEGLRRAGRDAEARALVARLARLDPARLPRVVGASLERVIHGDVERRRTDAGVIPFPGPMRSPAEDRAAPTTQGRPAMFDTVVDILGLCQASDDDVTVLRRVVAVLRERVQAVSVACFGREQDLTMVMAADGNESRAEAVARRAIDAGLAIAPTSTATGLEAAVPIRFAGTNVGAIACRWAADAVPDWSAAGAVLAAASAAVAPCVRTLLDRHATPGGAAEPVLGEIVGVSGPIADLRREVLRAAQAPFNVVIEGESGSGKELVARAIHGLGPRKHRPLCALNCAALSDDLVEAEMFGHARGAFTGAVAERKGLFEEADHGVLVLDEVGELTGRAQAKLLRAIQEGEVRRIGENFARSVDVRIVAATNRPLRPAVEAGLFRRDLLYRLEVIRIVVPPLRARAEDIPALAAHFWREATARLDSRCTLAPSTLAALARYDWPGNVRELQNVMAALAVSAGRRGSVGPERLPAIIAGQISSAAPQCLDEARRVFETRFVRAALAKAGGRRARAAGDLGLTRQGLAKLMARLGIE